MASRIPETIAAFDAYITSTDNFLQAISSGVIHNWERLGLAEADADEWHDRRVFWEDDLYVKYNDATLSTSIIKKNVQNFMKDFREFGNPQLNIMAANLSATAADEDIFNFIIEPAAATHTSLHIEDTVAVSFKLKGGSEVSFVCTTSHDGTSASKAEGSDSVQMAWMIIEEEQSNPGPMPTPPTDDAPDADDPRMTRDIFTKSRFEKHFGTAHLKKQVVCYFRWYNTKHPELAGPWTNITAIVIA